MWRVPPGRDKLAPGTFFLADTFEESLELSTHGTRVRHSWIGYHSPLLEREWPLGHLFPPNS